MGVISQCWRCWRCWRGNSQWTGTVLTLKDSKGTSQALCLSDVSVLQCSFYIVLLLPAGTSACPALTGVANVGIRRDVFLNTQHLMRVISLSSYVSASQKLDC